MGGRAVEGTGLEILERDALSEPALSARFVFALSACGYLSRFSTRGRTLGSNRGVDLEQS